MTVMSVQCIVCLRGASDTELIEYLYKTETETIGVARFGKRDHLLPVVEKLRKIDVRL